MWEANCSGGLPPSRNDAEGRPARWPWLDYGKAPAAERSGGIHLELALRLDAEASVGGSAHLDTLRGSVAQVMHHAGGRLRR